MIELAPIFTNGMILQRDRKVSIWGWEDNGTEVFLAFEGETYRAEVADGKFMFDLPAHPAATGLSMTVKGSSTIEISDICFGDVFYLAGQSNMELPVYRTMDVSREEVENSNYPYIRQYRLSPQYNMSEDVIADLPKNAWTDATPAKIGEMSAAGFYCARRVYDQKQIPIGLVLGAQGGSSIESWMPVELIKDQKEAMVKLSLFKEADSLKKYLVERDQQIASWRNDLSSEDDTVRTDTIPEETSSYTVPGLLSENGAEGFFGVLWFYKEFILNEEPGKDAFLYLGDLIDADATYVNGTLVGKTEYRYPPRKYPFDGSVLRKGRNLITVRLIVEGVNGGFVAEHPYYLTSGSERVELSGSWKMAYGKKAERHIPRYFLGQEIPTSLYKASVRPLKDFTFRGIWWYQGEANSENPRGYSEKFSSMISNWRTLYGQDLPVIAVEMPDYTDPFTGEVPDGWASIQEQQREAEKVVPGCAVVSAKDLFTPLELHPQRKSELGARMAEAVLKMYYGQQ